MSKSNITVGRMKQKQACLGLMETELPMGVSVRVNYGCVYSVMDWKLAPGVISVFALYGPTYAIPYTQYTL